ncbi:hypothetical protein F5I97DRAFT_998330 [Phlebopus sp. FC_14]|nr:hypothetical protein F5I97DRAFT_998330 [Phlebopus sp. FC_14]
MDPALGVLWRTQHALSPLVMCLPEDLWEKRSSNTIYFKRSPLPEDWTQLRRYSRRIQRITHPKMFTLPRLEEEILRAVLTPDVFGSLFPSLHTLDFTILSIASPVIGLLKSVLSPRITDLSFALPQNVDADTIRGLFEAILRMARSLEILRISSFGFSSFEMNLAGQDFPYLHDLSLSHNILLSSQSLLHLAGLRYLRKLNFRLPNNFDGALLRSAPRAFSALQHVKINTNALPQCTAFFSTIVSAHLESVSFFYDTQTPSTDLTAFLHQVHLTCTRTPTFHTLALQHNIQLSFHK